MAETPEHVIRWFHAEVQKLSPVAAGSLCLRKSPCIRKNCPACARGEGHSSYALYGRRVQELVSKAGVRYTRALKAKRRKESRR